MLTKKWIYKNSLLVKTESFYANQLYLVKDFYYNSENILSKTIEKTINKAGSDSSKSITLFLFDQYGHFYFSSELTVLKPSIRENLILLENLYIAFTKTVWRYIGITLTLHGLVMLISQKGMSMSTKNLKKFMMLSPRIHHF